MDGPVGQVLAGPLFFKVLYVGKLWWGKTLVNIMFGKTEFGKFVQQADRLSDILIMHAHVLQCLQVVQNM